jgi:hypothetical protein
MATEQMGRERTARRDDAVGAVAASAWQPPAHSPALKRHRAFLPRRGVLGLLFVAALSAAVAAAMIVSAGAGRRRRPPRSRRTTCAARSRASPPPWRRRTPRSSAGSRARRPAGVPQRRPARARRGAGDVPPAVPRQPHHGLRRPRPRRHRGALGAVTGTYELSRAGRDGAGGGIVFGVKRERGEPKVALIAAEPGSS